MELENSFVVPADIETAWKTLLDVEAIAPCMPGATLTSFDGDNFTADVKVKLGPVTMNFAGAGKFVTKDEATHTAVIDASGKETKGAGTAGALITAVLVEEGPNSTRANIVTDLTVTGKAAQFGKGVMADVSKRLIGQFAGNLEQVIVARQGVADAAVAAAAAGGETVVAAAPAPAPVMNNEALDLGNAALVPVLKRVVPGRHRRGGRRRHHLVAGHPLVRSKACARSRNTRTVRKSVRHRDESIRPREKRGGRCKHPHLSTTYEPLRWTTPSPSSRSMVTRLDSSPAATASSP